MCKCNSTLIDPGYSQNYGYGCQGVNSGYSYGCGCGCGTQEIVPPYTPPVVDPGYSYGCGNCPTYGCGGGCYDSCCYVVPAALRLPSGFIPL